MYDSASVYVYVSERLIQHMKKRREKKNYPHIISDFAKVFCSFDSRSLFVGSSLSLCSIRRSRASQQTPIRHALRIQ